jgi:hypothetical protein
MSTESSSNTRHRVGAEPDWYEPYAISLGIRVGNLVASLGRPPSTSAARPWEAPHRIQPDDSPRSLCGSKRVV